MQRGLEAAQEALTQVLDCIGDNPPETQQVERVLKQATADISVCLRAGGASNHWFNEYSKVALQSVVENLQELGRLPQNRIDLTSQDNDKIRLFAEDRLSTVQALLKRGLPPELEENVQNEQVRPDVNLNSTKKRETGTLTAMRDILPSLDDVQFDRIMNLGLGNSATPRLINFEEGVRHFLNKFRELSSEEIKERAQFAAADSRFPVFAEFRLNYGDRGFCAASLFDIVNELATALGYQPANYPAAIRRKLLAVFNPQSVQQEDLQYIYNNSPAILELRDEVAKSNLNLMIKSGVSYNSLSGDYVLRLLVVLDGTNNIYDFGSRKLGDKLFRNPASMGSFNLKS